jgi:outer membrane protein
LARGQLDNSFEAIHRLTGRDWAQYGELSITYPIRSLTPVNIQPWIDKALAGNLSLQLAELDVASAEKDRSAKRSRHLPTLDFVATYSSDNGFESNNSTGELDSTFVGLQFNLPLYRGGLDSSRVREVTSRLDAAIQSREDIKRGVIQDVRSLFRDLMTDVESVAAQKQSIVSNGAALAATSAGYSVGTRNIVDVLQAERRLYTAIQDYQAARYSYVRNALQFDESLGNLSADNVQQLDQWVVAADAEPSLFKTITSEN